MYIQRYFYLSLPLSLSFRLRYAYTCVDVHLYASEVWLQAVRRGAESKQQIPIYITVVLRICAVRYSPATNQGVSGRMSTYQSQVSRSGSCHWQRVPALLNLRTPLFANKSILFIHVNLPRVYHGSTSTERRRPPPNQSTTGGYQEALALPKAGLRWLVAMMVCSQDYVGTLWPLHPTWLYMVVW